MYKEVVTIAVEAGEAILGIYTAYANGSAEAAAIQIKGVSMAINFDPPLANKIDPPLLV